MLKASIHYPLPQFSLCAELSIEQGSIVGIYGPSGAGKSSLLACISGVVKGQNVINNHTKITHLSAEQKGVSHQLQGSQLFPHLNVAGNLLFACKHRPKSNNQISYEEVVEKLEITELLNRDVSLLSGGEAQRVIFARTLLVGQSIILLDEPFSALDWQKRYVMLGAIRYFSQAKNITFMLVSHSLKELCFCCEQLVYLVNGQIITQAKTEQAINTIIKQQGSMAFSYIKIADVEFIATHQLYKLRLSNSQQFLFENSVATQVSQTLCINADQVNLMLELPKLNDDTNILQCNYQHVVKRGSRVDVYLKVDGQTLICSLSSLQWQHYTLTSGQIVYAQIPVHMDHHESALT